MSYRRFYIRAGATTTAGGTVKASSEFSILDGVPLAREGDLVECPACGEQGRIECVMPRLSDVFEGKEYALSDDLCVCACRPPPRLITDQDTECQVLDEFRNPD
ncbi:MAG: PAAR domain-containing protein [Pseudomonadota bacterium]